MQTFIVFIILSTILRCSLALRLPEQFKDDIETIPESHNVQKLLSSQIQLGTGGGIQCYDNFNPKITAATEMSKTGTKTCILHAQSRRHDELNKVKEQREQLDNEVKYMTNTLSYCLGKSNHMDYLKCLKDYYVTLLATTEEVSNISSQLSDYLTCVFQNIACSEDVCIKEVLAKSKKETDDLLVALQNCLINEWNNDEGLNSGYLNSTMGESNT